MSAVDATIGPVPARSAPSWLEIPRLAARLLWRHWPVLLFWFFFQRVSYDLMMAVAIRLAEWSVLLSFAALAALVVFQLIGTIAMFHALRPSLPVPAAGRRTLARWRSDEPMVNALAVALLPFFAYYASWGLLEGVKRDFHLSYIFGIWHEQQEPLHDILRVHGLWIALVVAWAVRHVSKRRADSTGHARWSVLATVCEAYWVFVGVVAIGKLVGLGKDWWQGRQAYVAVAEWWQNPFAGVVSLQPLKAVADPLRDAIATAAGAAVMPLVWLAITALVYGLDLKRRHRFDRADARLRYAGARYRRLHFIWQKTADKASSGWTKKGVPIVNSLRLVLRAGLPALLTLCVCWQLLAFVDAWAWRVIAAWIGPRETQWWNVIGQPIGLLFNGPLSIRPALFTELLRVALLAATFGCAVARMTRRRAEPAPDGA